MDEYISPVIRQPSEFGVVDASLLNDDDDKKRLSTLTRFLHYSAVNMGVSVLSTTHTCLNGSIICIRVVPVNALLAIKLSIFLFCSSLAVKTLICRR